MSQKYSKLDKMTVKEHYSSHLGNFYAWMAGDFQAKSGEQQAFFRSKNITATQPTLALDLGAGHGLQSVALAHLGFSVKAVDFNKQLLGTLRTNAKGLPIEVIEADIIDYITQATDQVALICCMGDTLTHLPDLKALGLFFKHTARLLEPGGKAVFSFRDLTSELTGTQRFIPVKSDETRILTCFLEYFPAHVVVHDILHEKQDGIWAQKVSAYPKLRISEHNMRELLQNNGLTATSSDVHQRMIYIVVEKPV